MPSPRGSRLLAAFVTAALHALVLVVASHPSLRRMDPPDAPAPQEIVLVLETPAPQDRLPEPVRPELLPAPQPPPAAAPILEVPPVDLAAAPAPDRPPATMAAPAAPTAEEWALAGQYTLKNSKRYRYTWGQQVRSMMGTAVEGPDQGLVRFRVEIAPDGTLAQLQTLWATSAVAERLAREAIVRMPPLPPTPTGQPLVFERTISFSPFATDGPPVYRDDCLPDPPAFRNPFAWDGKSPQTRADPAPTEKLDPQALEECLRQLPRDTIEAEAAQDRRLMDQWGSGKSGR